MSQITNGKLYQESSHPEVYVIYSGRKIWIPTPDALVAMGYAWSDITVVPDGALSNYPRFNIPSSSATPGSLVYPPDRRNRFPLTGIPITTVVPSQGKEIHLVELYGWLRGVDDGCGDGKDFYYYLELDTDWAISQGINLHRILRVGNVAREAIRLPGYSPRRAVSLPLIKVELNSWGWGENLSLGDRQPADWTYRGNCDRLWPFDPYLPNADGNRQLDPIDWDIDKRGPYVRMVGSLITDHPHDEEGWTNTFFSRYFAITDSDGAEWRASVPDWHPKVGSRDQEHFARWTEMHPPDLIEILTWKEPLSTVRAVALAARVGVLPFGLSNSCEQVEFDIYPEAQRPTNSKIAYEELRGPETFFPWGENADNGSWITVFDDHIHVKAKVCGGPPFDSPGRFKAIYRVWWEQLPPPPPPLPALSVRVQPYPVPLGRQVQLTVHAQAAATQIPVSGKVRLYNFDARGRPSTVEFDTNTPFSITLRRKVIRDPRTGQVEDVESPTATVSVPGYQDASIDFGI